MNLRLSGQRIDIDALAQQVCRKYNISLGELRSGSCRWIVVEARGSISWIAVKELGYSGADVARYLGMTNSYVTRFVASDKKSDEESRITFHLVDGSLIRIVAAIFPRNLHHLFRC